MAKTREEVSLLNKLKKEVQRPQTTLYFIGMFVLLCAVMMIDEFASSTPNSVQTAVVNEFFVQGMGQTSEQGAASFSLLSTLTMPISILAVLFISLCDRVGRKPILIASVIGMGAAMLVCFWSPNFEVHVIGRLLVTFFIATDVHQIYMLEIAPQKNRALFMNIATGVGILGTMFISIARSANTREDMLNWRRVFLVPIIGCIVCILLIALVAKETIPFLQTRIAFLEKTPEQRRAEREETKRNKKKDAEQSGILPAFKYVFTHKQARRILLLTIPNGFAMMTMSGYYELLMTTSGMSTTQVSAALLVYPLASATVAVLTGVIADKLGRRPALVITAGMAVVFLFLFVYGAVNQWNLYIVGILYGIEVRSYWGMSGINGLAFKENIPTRIRASAGAVSGIFGTIVMMLGSIFVLVIVSILGLSPACLIWSTLMMGISAVGFFFLVKETKDVELETIE